MWKLALVLFVAALGSVQSQLPIQLVCNFQITIFNEYSCRLEGIQVLDETAEIEIIGEHLEGMSDEDILVLQIRNSNTPFMIQQFFTSFPNMYEIDIETSNLESINIPETVQLVWAIFYRNNITRLGANDIRGQERLSYLELIDNGIEEIDEAAFANVTTLNSLVLINNRITEIVGSTLHPLTSASYIDFERNLIASLHDHTFAENQNLYSLYLEYNLINAIHPLWVRELEQTLRFVNLLGNQCVDRSFPLQNEEGWGAMHNGLQDCYNNWNGTTPELRRITLEFSGPLVISDEFGNVIVRV